MRLHFLMSISVVFTHPGWRKQTLLQSTMVRFSLTFQLYLLYFTVKPKRAGKTENMWKEDEVGGYNLSRSRRRLTTGLWTSQKALSWLSRIFLSVLSFFLSILRVRSDGVRKMARGSPGISVRGGSRIRMEG